MNRIRLVRRDIDIIKYVYDMKFCASSEIFEMFFCSDGVGQRYSFVRLKKLVDAGYLKIFKNNLYRFNFFYITDKGLNLIENEFHDSMFPLKAPTKIDFRFFEHDLNVAKCRTALEKKGLASDWISERIITHDILTKGGVYRSKYMLQNLKRSQIPDGLFKTRKGEVCAFELEYTMKSTRELKEKLTNLYNESRYQSGLFSRVLIVAASSKIESSLNKINRELNANFKIMKLQELTNEQG